MIDFARIRVVSTERPELEGKGRGSGGRTAVSLSWQAARAQAAAPGSLRLAAA
jgi:hypothetical protein